MSEYFWRKVIDYGGQLDRDLAAAEPAGDGADACLEMATAYLEDGHHFLEHNDLANALAAFAYGHGWLDAGLRLGVLTDSTEDIQEIR